jgi:hypothetical protein
MGPFPSDSITRPSPNLPGRLAAASRHTTMPVPTNPQASTSAVMSRTRLAMT